MGSDAVFVRALVADAINPSESDNLRLHLQGQYAFGSQRVQRNLAVAPGLPRLAGPKRTKTQSKKCTLTRVFFGFGETKGPDSLLGSESSPQLGAASTGAVVAFFLVFLWRSCKTDLRAARIQLRTIPCGALDQTVATCIAPGLPCIGITASWRPPPGLRIRRGKIVVLIIMTQYTKRVSIILRPAEYVRARAKAIEFRPVLLVEKGRDLFQRRATSRGRVAVDGFARAFVRLRSVRGHALANLAIGIRARARQTCSADQNKISSSK